MASAARPALAFREILIGSPPFFVKTQMH